MAVAKKRSYTRRSSTTIPESAPSKAAGHPSAQGDKLLTVAERNIRSFLRSATFKSESDREAALNCVDVLWEAARAPANSVTAPAGRATAEPRWKSEDFEVTHYPPTPTTGMRVGMPKGVKVTHRPTGLFAVSEDERSQHRNREVAWNKLQEMLSAAPTPPAQAQAGAVPLAGSEGPEVYKTCGISQT